MRILLDDCVKHDVLSYFSDHQVAHAADIGWAHLKNGELLQRANKDFDVLVTVDKSSAFKAA